MSEEHPYANPITGQPHDALTWQEYAAIRRRRPKVLPCNCHDCGKRVDDGRGWWATRDGKLELCCYECRFPTVHGEQEASG